MRPKDTRPPTVDVIKAGSVEAIAERERPPYEKRETDLPVQFALLTVQHTGTNSVVNKIARELDYEMLKLGHIVRDIEDKQVFSTFKPDDPIIFWGHVHWAPVPWVCRNMMVITTTRDKADVEASWERREAHKRHGKTLEEQVSLWNKWVLPVAKYVINVDDPDETLIEMGLTPGLPRLNTYEDRYGPR